MSEAFFSEIAKQIIQNISCAKSTVDIAMAWFTNNLIFDALIKCLKRNVSIRLMLLDSEINWFPWAPDFESFVTNRGQLYVYGKEHGFLHDKFCIIDDKKLITGSYNWTYYAESRNKENILVTDSSNIVEAYRQEFQTLLDVCNREDNPTKLTWEQIAQDDDVDFVELNYEIKSLAKLKGETDFRTFKRKSTVVLSLAKDDISQQNEASSRDYIINPKEQCVKQEPFIQTIDSSLNTVSNYNFGIVNKDKDYKVLLAQGTKLPTAGVPLPVYLISQDFCLNLSRWKQESTPETIIENLPLNDLFKDFSNNLSVTITINLQEDGHLKVEACCPQTKLKKVWSLTNPDFVRYE